MYTGITYGGDGAPPKITVQPESQRNVYGANVEFGITATGENLKYQWQYKPRIKGGTWTNSTDSGATTNKLKLVANDQNEYLYRCLVSNDTYSGDKAIMSNAASLYVIDDQIFEIKYISETPTAPVITTQPLSQMLSVGEKATFTVEATGTDLTYQWQYKPSLPNSAWTNLTKSDGIGFDTNTFTTAVLTGTQDHYQYRCLVRSTNYYYGDENAKESDSATLQVTSKGYVDIQYINEEYEIVEQPASQSVYTGTTVKFRVDTTGSTNLTYRWLYKAPGTNTSWTEVPDSMGNGAKTAELTISPVKEEYENYQFRCSVGGEYYKYEEAKLSSIATLLLLSETQIADVQFDNSKLMITEWTIPADNTVIKLPVQGTGLNITVDWGDGSATETVTTQFPTHTYATAGVYEIAVAGECPEWGYSSYSLPGRTSNYYTYTQYLTKVKQFGELNATKYGFTYCEKLTEVSGDNLVTDKTFEKVTSMAYMFNFCSGLTTLDASNFNTSNVTNMSWMFQYCKNLISLDLSNFDTSKVTDMSYMFSYCNSLTSLNISNFNTSNVIGMTWMFYDCRNLTSLDLSSFNTSKVTSMLYMFSNCSSTTSLDVSNFDTSKVTNMKNMFSNCKSLTSLDVSSFNTSNTQKMISMFSNCQSLTSLDVSNFDTSSVDNMESMFSGCTNLKSILLSEKFTVYSGTTNMFSNCSKLTAVITTSSTPVENQFKGLLPSTATLYVPNGSEEAYKATLSGDTTLSQIKPIIEPVGETNMTLKLEEEYTEQGCTVAGFTEADSKYYTCYGYALAQEGTVDTSKEGTYTVKYSLTKGGAETSSGVRNVEVVDKSKYMITEWTIPSGDTEIKLPVQGTGLNITVDWGDGSSEQTVTTAFPTHTYATAGTYEIKIRGNCPEWGYAENYMSASSDYYTYTQYLTKVKQFGELSATQYGFAWCGKLTEVSGENLVTRKTFEKVTDMSNMFFRCYELTNLDASGFYTGKVTNMMNMFYFCENLTNLDVSEFDTSNVKDMSWMFGYCQNLTSLNVSGFNTSNVKNMRAMFSSCGKLTSLDVSNFNTSSVTDMNGMFYSCGQLTNLDVSSFNTSNIINMSCMFTECTGLTSIDVSNFNTNNVTDLSGMFSKCKNLTILNVSNFNTSKVTDMSGMFSSCSGLTNIDVSNFDTSNVTDISRMFYFCGQLTSLDLSGFDTSKVTNMQMMFEWCNNLKSLQLSDKFEIPTSKNGYMFDVTSNLKSIILVDITPLANQFTSIKNQLDGKTIYVPNKDAETVYEEAWSGDFSGDRIRPILELIGEENIKTNKGEKYTDAGATVAGFTSINSTEYTPYGYNLTSSGEVDTTTIGTYKIEYTLIRTYNNGTNTVTEEIMKATRTVEVVEIDPTVYMITEWTIPSANTTIKLPVQGTGLNITVDWGDGTDVETVTTAFPTHIYEIAGTYEIKVRGNCPEWGYAGNSSIYAGNNYYTYTQYLTKVKQFGELNATKYGFTHCENLTEVSGENLATKKTFEKVTDMSYMFNYCGNLTAFGTKGFDTSNVTNMEWMFRFCNSLINIDLSELDTENVTNMCTMFVGCTNLTNLDLKSFNTSKVTDMSYMFADCNNLINLELSSFDTSNVKDMTWMFYGCSNLTNLDLSGFDTSNVTNMQMMFGWCNNLKSLQLSSKFVIPISNVTDMFTNTSNLKSIIMIDNTPLANQFASIKDQLDGKTIYVPNKEAEAVYEEAWSGDFSGDRIRPILELVGEEKIAINKGETYTEAGATVAGFTKANSGDYTVYGYNLTSSGEVNTAVVGTYKIEYTLTRTHNNGTGTVTEEIMKATRTVEVIDTASYMITEWNVSGDVGLTITLPVSGTGLNITVDWGDGSAIETITTEYPTHTYAQAGVYEIAVAGNCPEWGKISYQEFIAFGETSRNYTYAKYLTNVIQLGELNATKYIFAKCENLTSFKGEKLVSPNTFANVNTMGYMFWGCTNLKEIDLTNFDAQNVTDMNRMFSGCHSLVELDLTSLDTSKVTDMNETFGYCKNLENLNISNLKTNLVKNMPYMFAGCVKLKTLDFSSFDTSNVTNMAWMFGNCSSLESLDLSSFDTSNVKNMDLMFNNCGAKTINVSSFDTSNVESMYCMFQLTKVKQIDLSSFKTQNLKSMTGMFAWSSFESLDLSSFDTSNVTGMVDVFKNCGSLGTLDISSFDTTDMTRLVDENGNVTEGMDGILNGTSKLKSIQISDKFVIPNGSENVFNNCNSLTAIITTSPTPVANQFKGLLPETATLYVPNGVEDVYKATLSGDTSLSQIKPIIEPVGETNMTLKLGEEYTEQGCTVAGFTEADSKYYTCYGYTLAQEGTVDTSREGTYTVKYSLTKDGAETSSGVRNVDVVDKSKYMITEWNVSGDVGLTITLPVSGTGLNITVDWGDGTTKETITTAFPTHTYAQAGIYEIAVAGNCPVWGCLNAGKISNENYNTYMKYLTKVKQFGELNAKQYGFTYCENLTEVKGATTKTTQNLERLEYMFNSCTSLTSVDLTNFKTESIESFRGMFLSCKVLTNLNISDIRTNSAKYMDRMFESCESLSSIDLSNFITDNVSMMSRMFFSCKNISTLDLSSFNTSNVERMNSMFEGCTELNEIKFGNNFNTSKVTTMESMFSGCRKLKISDLTGFDTSNVTNMRSMFNSCVALKNLNVTNFDTSKVTDFSTMFYNMLNIETLDISNFDTRSGDTLNMFVHASKLKSIQIGENFMVPEATTEVFQNCSSLTAVITTSETPVANQFKGMLPSTATLYVPNGSEDAYKTTLSGDTDEAKIEPLLQLVGNEKTKLSVSEEAYTDAGYTVAGFTEVESNAYTCYGYSVTSSGEVNRSEAGIYKITYKITRTYEKEGQTITTEPYEVTREIEVEALPLEIPTMVGDYTYTGILQTLQLKNLDTSKMEIVGNTATNAGNYTATIKIKNKKMYAWKDGTTQDIKIAWEIKPIIAEITWSATTIVYDGTQKQITAIVSNTVNGEIVTVTAYDGTIRATNVGEYTAKVKSLSSTNYTLEGALNTEKKWYIQVAVVDMQVIMQDYSYGGTLVNPSITNNTVGRNVAYYYNTEDANTGGTAWSTVTNSLSIPVGTYYMYAIVEATQNYQETITDPVMFKVLATQLTLNMITEDGQSYQNEWTNQSVYITLTKNGGANVTAYQYKIGTSGSWIDQVTLPIVLENTTNDEIKARGINPAGRVVTEEVSAGVVKIDKTNPTIANITYKHENKILSVIFALSDGQSGISAYAITPRENMSKEWTTSEEGTKQVEVSGSGIYYIWAKDKVGNIAYKTIKVIKDIIPPTAKITVKEAYTVENNKYYVNQNTVTISVDASDNQTPKAQIQMAIYKEADYKALASENDIVWEAYKLDNEWTVQKENAEEKVYVILKDLAGNITVKVGE